MLDHLNVAGATLAALLQSCYTNDRSCVGLLFGDVATAVSSQAQDTTDDVLVTRSVGHISGSVTCVSTHAFYDNTGDISEEQLAVLLSDSSCSSSSSSPGSKLLGWFSYRPGTPCMPSMLEAAVCQKLQALLASSEAPSSSGTFQQQQQQQPLVFGLITSQLEHGGATVSLQHRFFAYHPDNGWQQDLYCRPSSTFASFGGGTGGTSRAKAVQHPNLRPLQLQVLNLGEADMQRLPAAAAAAAAATGGGGSWGGNQFTGGTLGQTGAGGQASSSSSSSNGSGCTQQLAALAAALEGSGGAVQKVQQQLLAVALQVDAAGGQLSVVEGLYSSLLEELQAAAAAAGSRMQVLVAVREEHDRLRHQLRARQQQQQQGSGGSGRSAPGSDLL